MEGKKYEIIEFPVGDLYRIRALKDFSDVKKGDIGGFVSSEYNLSQIGDCWIYNNAKICDNARVYGNAKVYDYAKVYGNVEIYGNTNVFDYAEVCSDAEVCGYCLIKNSKIYSNAKICINAEILDSRIDDNAYIASISDYVTIGPIGSRNDYTTFYLTKDKKIYVSYGCYNDSIEEFEKAVNTTHKDNKQYKKQYLYSIKCAKDMLLLNRED